nr:hypothetical protein Iba_chr02eCG5890 [Ipomoea batatas]
MQSPIDDKVIWASSFAVDSVVRNCVVGQRSRWVVQAEIIRPSSIDDKVIWASSFAVDSVVRSCVVGQRSRLVVQAEIIRPGPALDNQCLVALSEGDSESDNDFQWHHVRPRSCKV